LSFETRLTYLAKVRNPTPAMPDYQEAPLSFQNYEKQMGDPFEHEAAEGHAGEKGAH